ncbi:hypothetical protein EBQ26_06435 [Allofranklinella schreckenbergeri]|uniref:Uncharacterized protein n=1 Tax=Allofranklinella schreckenbergeri TaxID=1076744 RepID=A0A3M6Q6Z0_9BURK|nr:hypothetical protein EBQ26_06435 [Allofranklinella schreckenbergeri]
MGAQGANGRAIDGAVHGQTAADVIGAIDPQLLQDGGGLLGEGGWHGQGSPDWNEWRVFKRKNGQMILEKKKYDGK